MAFLALKTRGLGIELATLILNIQKKKYKIFILSINKTPNFKICDMRTFTQNIFITRALINNERK